VRLQPNGEPLAQADGSGVRQSFVVETVSCPGKRLHPAGGIVLVSSLDSQYLLALQGMVPGETVTASWSLGWGGVMDTIGGNPTLIEAGQIVSTNVDGCGWFCGRHPRTGVGTTPDGRVLLVTVDGRQPKRSVGMTLREFAELFQSLGADWALNLDGGGSTTMVVEGRVTNRPSDRIKNEAGKWERVERAVSSALVLLPGADPDEQPAPAPSGSPSPAPTTSPSPSPTDSAASGAEVLIRALDLGWRFPSLGTSRSARRIVRDPASTGGMLDAMARRGYRLPAELRMMLRSFRAR
jgi:hypothetical protein